jgi:hypothetical protein
MPLITNANKYRKVSLCQEIDVAVKETPRRRITVNSSLKEMSTDQLRNKVVVRGAMLLRPHHPLPNPKSLTGG